jgi:hypothetical protein
MLAIGHRLPEFIPGRKRWIFEATKIRSTTYFGWEIKPSAPCRKILRHIKDTLRYDKDFDKHKYDKYKQKQDKKTWESKVQHCNGNL